MYKRILIYILIIIFIYLLYKKQENNVDSVVPLSNEAIQNIASVYNNQDMRVTNMTATGIIKGNFIGDISSNIIKTIDISSNTINTNNIIINNKKFRMFSMRLGGRLGMKLIKDSSGNTYDRKDWILFSGGFHWSGLHIFTLVVNKKDNLWYINNGSMNSTYKEYSILCIPVELFDTNFTKHPIYDNIIDTTASDEGAYERNG